MTELLRSLGLLAVFYVAAMIQYRAARQGMLLPLIRFGSFLCAWGCLVAIALPVWKLFTLFRDLFEHPNTVAFLEISSVLLLIGLLLKVLIDRPDVHDLAHVGPFLRQALLLRDPAAYRVGMPANNAAAKRSVKRSAAVSVSTSRSQVSLTEANAAEYRRQLERGEPLDLTDDYRLFLARSWNTGDTVAGLRIDPTNRTLAADLVREPFHAHDRLNADRVFRFQQDVYEEFQRIDQLALLHPFLSHFDRIQLHWFHPDEDGFGAPVRVPFCRTAVMVSELRKRSDKMFIATELDRIAQIEWIDEPS